ncbi:ABC transporter ATP-binding protein [uncultured Oscillibacter sp.]|uniref:ABC transporter ATP-binding protein n=1 Tax=uncultured Oscillibacter sp. TaxID=876091 RepID=UPI00261BEC0A|nr:ABC transporter ATP-binding protein [uncultured Oscillibacter sp.]
MPQEILRFEQVSKFFPGVVANDKVDLTIYKGEIHSLLGENGAGKSTLMNILYGLYKADGGQIYYEGRPVSILSPNDALKHGIGMIHQHFMLIPNFTVWENVTLGQKMEGSPVLPVTQLKQKVQEIAGQLHMNIDVNQLVGELSVGVQQKVEILKAIYRGARLLILDEPTSVLTPQESEELFVTLDRLKGDGCTIIFISHKLNEVMSISDRVSVLRDGHLIETRDKEGCTPAMMTALMVGRDVNLAIEKKPCIPGEVALEVRDLCAAGETHASTLKHISFQVRAGEIVGIAGVDGNGQGALSNAIAGIQKPESGTVLFRGEDVTAENVRRRNERKFSYIPADRRGEGLTLDFKLFENIALTQYYKEPCSKKGLLNFRGMRERAAAYMKDFNVKAPNTEAEARNLSGGNQQKLVLAREILKRPDILLVVQPTWGLDIGACEFVYQKIVEERDRGAAVLLISTDLEEVRNLSDRLLVLFEGQIMGEVDPAVARVEDIGQLMAGSQIQQ